MGASIRHIELAASLSASEVTEWERLPAHIEYERAAWIETRARVAGAFMPLAEVTVQMFGEITAREQAFDPSTNYGAY